MEIGFLMFMWIYGVGVIYFDGVYLNLIWIWKYFVYREGFC